MNILVANIGSTSFKYRLYAMPGETLLARGGVERIGAPNSVSYVLVGEERHESVAPVADHAKAVEACLDQLTAAGTGCLARREDIAAIGFKAVHAKKMSGVQVVDDVVLDAMEAYAVVCPAHNPPYIRAMRQLREALPALPLVAAFETGFHQTTPAAHRFYAVPLEWADRFGVVRHGFHGASHRYIAGRVRELLSRDDLRIVSCHLGGSSSLAAIRGETSLGNSMGMSPQSGLPHNNRVGDFDPFALPVLMAETGRTLEELLGVLASQSGLEGISGASNDLRDIEAAALAGDSRSRLALDVFVGSVRDWLGSMIVRLGGLDVLVFTGGIGEHSASMRLAICERLESLGIVIDPNRNAQAKGEAVVSSGPVAVWTIPTNEEIVVARQTFTILSGGGT